MHKSRAVSTTLGYVLTLAISTLLITGLIAAGGSYIETEREQVITDELTVIGQQLASDVERTDRLVRAADGSSPTVQLNKTFSDQVTGTSYRISLGSSEVVLTWFDPEITVSIQVNSQTDLGDSTADGGPIQVWYDDADGELEVRDV